jgi:hypothetical protein
LTQSSETIRDCCIARNKSAQYIAARFDQPIYTVESISMAKASGLATKYADAWLIDGIRTPFVDYNGALGAISPTDLGIKVAFENSTRDFDA